MSEQHFQYKLPMHFAAVPAGWQVAGIDLGGKIGVFMFTNWDAAADFVDDKPELEVYGIETNAEMVDALERFTQRGFSLVLLDPAAQSGSVVNVLELAELRRLVLAVQAEAN